MRITLPFSGENGRLYQYLATFTGAFAVVASGINLGWTSPYLPYLESKNSTIPTTSDEGSWCAVMPLIGSPPGAILAAILADKIGRKYTTLLMTPLIVFPMVLVALAQNIWVISAARFIGGAAEGALYTSLPMYIGEISDPQIRGFLTSCIALLAISGTLFINIIGPFTSIFLSSLISVAVPVIHFITYSFMPKSPYFCIKKGNYGEAKESLKTLRGTKDVDGEFNELCKAVARQEQSENARITDIVTVPSNRRACLIFIIICLTNKFSGKNPVMFYTEAIFKEAGSSIDSSLSAIIYCAVELFATSIAIIIVDRFGKRPLMITSSAGCSISVFLLALHFFLKTFSESITEYLDWLPITALVSYNILFSVGLAFGPVSALGELFPTNVKAPALCIADTFSVLMGTVASKFFQITKDSFGMYTPFWFFSLCSAIGTLFIVKYLPETKGKSLEEIQQYLIAESQETPELKKKNNISV